jgi:ubiquitin C-terminal hydrolase
MKQLENEKKEPIKRVQQLENEKKELIKRIQQLQNENNNASAIFQNMNAQLIEKNNIINNQANTIEQLKKQIIKPSKSPFLPEKPPLKGLQNIGSTCYMNATLQCFSQTWPLTEYFLNPSHENLIKNGLFNNNNGLRLANSYYTVVSNLWKIDGKKAFEPKDFKFVLGKLNPLFEKMEVSDAKDMIIFFLEQIHKEINLVNPQKTSKFNPNQYDKMNVLKQFLEEFKKKINQ